MAAILKILLIKSKLSLKKVVLAYLLGYRLTPNV